ncbi:diguanylate cyclase [Thermodesulfobacteriota bacterium]
MTEQVLIVEDSNLFGTLLKKEIEANLECKVLWVKTYAEAQETIKSTTPGFFIALLDLNLPDAPDGEIVDLVLEHDIPSIVFTGDITDEARETIWQKKVVDYVIKEGPQSIDYIVSLINRIKRNESIKVMIVDDSRFSRKHISDLLAVHKFIIFEAVNGQEALDILEKNRDIKMVITDFNMPVMDGFELTKQIRQQFGRDELSIIGVSGLGNNILSAQFIKFGANDFIYKPFVNEEFYCRINQAVEMIEYVKKIKDFSNKDFLTGLYNRRFFFDSGRKIYADAKRTKTTATIALVDIDFFKKINDTYGHDAGDVILKNLSQTLQNRFRETDIVARFGGEEFCILSKNMALEETFRIFDELRERVGRIENIYNDELIQINISIGVCTNLHGSLEEMIKQADLLLYKAKEEGRNRVEIDFTPGEDA